MAPLALSCLRFSTLHLVLIATLTVPTTLTMPRVVSNTLLWRKPQSCTVSADWLSLGCHDTDKLSEESLRTPWSINAIDGSKHGLLYGYSQFRPYHGPRQTQDGLLVDFMGFIIPHDLFCNRAYIGQTEAHALRTRQCDIYKQLAAVKPDATIQTQWPVISEEYFEYSDILNSVLDYTGGPAGSSMVETHYRKYAFVEIGAGYGHFTFAAHRALMEKAPDAQYKYLLVDVNANLLPEIEKLAKLNGVNMTHGSDSPIVFHHGFIGETDESNAQAMSDQYQTGWGLPPPTTEVKVAKTVSLQTLFDQYGMPCQIDMVDIDIQGSEYETQVINRQPGLFHGTAAIDLLTKRAKRVHIGTHSQVIKDDDTLMKKFEDRGWKRAWYFENGYYKPAPIQTDYGKIRFGDGVISYVNSNKLDCP